MDRLLVVTPRDIRFHFEVGQTVRAKIRIHSLMHTMPVAFKVFTTAPHRYAVQSQPVIIPPLGEHLLEVSMSAQSNLPRSIPYSQDKIYVKSLMVPTGKATHAELEKWFSTRKNHVFLDAVLRIVFTGKHVLWRLAVDGSIESMEEVLQDTNANVKDPHGWTALFIAARHSNAAAVKALIARKCDVNEKDSDGHTPLFVAVLRGNSEIVKMLLDAGASMEHRNTYGWTCLHVAAAQNRSDIVDLLLDAGADIDGHDSKGRTPLHVAALAGHSKVLNILVQHGANVDRRCDDGCTPLHAAVVAGVEEAVDVLLREGALVSAKNYARKTSHDLAREMGQIRVFDVMHVQQTLERAARKNDLKTVKECLCDGAYVNVCDQYGWTALHRAAFKGHVEIVRLLLKHNFDINMKDEKGYTPLQFAREAGHEEVVEVLLRHGAQDGKHGQMPMDLMYTSQHKDVWHVMQTHVF